MEQRPGIHFSSAGVAWEEAFRAALRFLRENENGILLLGPKLGPAGREWIQEHSLKDPPLRLGTRVLEWREWVKGRARANALEEGQGFVNLNAASQREFLRRILTILEETGSLYHLGPLWKEDRFFSALIDCVEEARMAGLVEAEALEKAQELLLSGTDTVTREGYNDLWSLLLSYEVARRGDGKTHDFPAVVQRAAAPALEEQDLFLLGFDQLSLLETDLLQVLAREHAVHIPVAMSVADLQALKEGRDPKEDHTATLFVRGLLTGFLGEITVSGGAEATRTPQRYMLEAHAPSEEARLNAAFARQMVEQGWNVRFVLPPGLLDEECVESAFREELGLPRNYRARRVLSHPVGRLFFHAFQLKHDGYELTHGLEFAQLLQFTLNRFEDIAPRATRAGVRAGLRDWAKKAEDRDDEELKAFSEFLVEIDKLIPEKATAGAFAGVVQKMAELCGIGNLARHAHDLESEREAHAVLAAMVRSAGTLSGSVKAELSFEEWMREWQVLLAKADAGSYLSFFPRLQFYRYGEWLPPADERTLTFLQGFDANVGPQKAFSFYFEETARRKLSDLQLVSQVQEDVTFLDQVRRMCHGGVVIFSRSLHNTRGKEQAPSWIAASLPLTRAPSPELARPIRAEPFTASEAVRTMSPEVKTFSASLLEVYKECPFKAFALKILRLEDKMQASSLDVGYLELGSIVHKTLELYYGEHKGKEVGDAEERERLLDLSLERAVREQKIDYFKGGAELLRVQVLRLRRMLLSFLALDYDNYARFPHFGQPLAEKKISGALGPFHFEGKVDRVDIDEVNKRFLVIDYKTGATTPKTSELEALERFQLQLYMDAMEKELPGFEAAGGVYVSLRTGDRKQGAVRKEFNLSKKEPEPGKTYYYGLHPRTGALKEEDAFFDLRARSRDEALRLAHEVQVGQFNVTPVDDDACKRCEVRPACRIRELRAPARQPWERLMPDFRPLLLPEAPVPEEKESSAKGFNPEQEDALSREGSLVFIEASAGTGKTTVIVERIKRFLADRLAAGDPGHRAVERFAAISFTEKSASELAERVSQSVMKEPGMGPRMAAQALKQISTIHGFCRRILTDFPVEAGISPLAELMDERESETLKEIAFEEFFLHAPPEAKANFDALFGLYPRAKIEGFLRKLQEQRLLLKDDLALYRGWMDGGLECPGSLVQPANAEKEVLSHVLALSDVFSEIYTRLKRERDVLDFNDLEGLALKVLEQPHARKFYQERFSLLLVDEFQDTNSVQRKILDQIALPGWQNLFVVGDAKQSIYRFRAADVSVFQNLRKQAEAGGNLITLYRNYRSREEVVAAANQVTASIFPAPGVDAPDYEAVAAEAKAFREGGGRCAIVEYGDPEEKLNAEDRRRSEAALLVQLVQDQIAKGRKPGQIAVLLRKISSNEAFLQALTRARIPYRVGSSRGFYSQSVILDGIALLRAIYGANNDMALLAVLRSPWVRLSDEAILKIQRRKPAKTPLWLCLEAGDAPQLFAWRKRASHMACSELISEACRYYPLDRREHLQTVKFLSILSSLEVENMPRVEIIERLSLWAGWEREEDSLDDSTMPEPGSGGAVQVMTVHASKGLEFDVTILPDLTGAGQKDKSALRVVAGVGMALKMEDEDNPAAYDEVGERNAERDLAESKRLLYVAMTRAKEECLLILPRLAPPKEGKEKKEKKKESWADFLRGAGLRNYLQVAAGVPAPELFRESPAPARGREGDDPRAPKVWFSATVTEIVKHKLCGEFHRRKFVQEWDDKIVALWPNPPEGYRPREQEKRSRKFSPERARAKKLLQKLHLENKDRGTVLHKVLERTKDFDLELARKILLQEYPMQGADPDSEHLLELVELDLQLLDGFLSSDLGAELFANPVEAHPEIKFEWLLPGGLFEGSIDRLIRREDGSWLVVDYKSSVTDENYEHYRWQVEMYMAVVAERARIQGEENPRVEGMLVDLFEAKAHTVEVDSSQAVVQLHQEIGALRANYTLTAEDLTLGSRGILPGEHCSHCPYAASCEVGKDFCYDLIK